MDGGRAATSTRRTLRTTRAAIPGRGAAPNASPTATVVAVRPTGLRISRDPVVEVELAVRRGDESWRVAHRDRVPLAAAEQVVPGATVRVTVDPSNRTRVRVDWSSAA